MIEINHTIDEDELKSIINQALDFKENEMLFGQLAAVSIAKKELKDSLDKIEKIETEAKGLINSKAKALYGNDWQVITATKYKILRSKTGAVYTLNPDIPVSKKFIKVVQSIDTDAVKAQLEKTEKLPKGIELNPTRGESIGITIK